MAQLMYTFRKFITSTLFQPSILHGSIILSTTSRKNPLKENLKKNVITNNKYLVNKLVTENYRKSLLW